MIEYRNYCARVVTPSWGQNDESTDIDAYCEHDQYDQRDRGDHRDALQSARPERVGRVSFADIGVNIRRNTRRRS
jgi:hypothetical protein